MEEQGEESDKHRLDRETGKVWADESSARRKTSWASCWARAGHSVAPFQKIPVWSFVTSLFIPALFHRRFHKGEPTLPPSGLATQTNGCPGDDGGNAAENKQQAKTTIRRVNKPSARPTPCQRHLPSDATDPPCQPEEWVIRVLAKALMGCAVQAKPAGDTHTHIPTPLHFVIVKKDSWRPRNWPSHRQVPWGPDLYCGRASKDGELAANAMRFDHEKKKANQERPRGARNTEIASSL